MKARVLIVDDEETIRKLLKSRLDRENCDAIIASSAEEAEKTFTSGAEYSVMHAEALQLKHQAAVAAEPSVLLPRRYRSLLDEEEDEDPPSLSLAAFLLIAPSSSACISSGSSRKKAKSN